MCNKIKKICTFLLSTLIQNAVYGIILYFVFTWLVGHSLLLAYIGNLVFIMLVLAIDEYMQKVLQSKKFAVYLKAEKDPEKTYRFLKRGLNSVGSFKSDLYLFYVIILIFSQITEFHPSFVGENLGSFIHFNNYSILVLVAFDMLISQISKDRANVKKILDDLKDSLADNQAE